MHKCDTKTKKRSPFYNSCAILRMSNKRVDVVFTSREKVSKGEECVTIDVNRVHFECPVCLKRLLFNKVSSRPLQHSGFNCILLFGIAIVGKSDKRVIIFYKCNTFQGTFSWYFLKLVKRTVTPLVDH